MVTYLNVYRKLEVIVWRKMRLISWRNSFKVFSIAAGSISFAFCFRPNIFLVRFKLAVTFQGRGRWGPWILIYCTDAMLINKGSAMQSESCVSVKCEPNNFRPASCDTANLRVVSYNSTSLWGAGCELIIRLWGGSRIKSALSVYIISSVHTKQSNSNKVI